MKKLLLTILASLIISFSFSQNASKDKDLAKMKFKTVEAVQYLANGLKLDAKQKAIFMNAFSEYANNVLKANKKAKAKNKTTDVSLQDKTNQKRELNAYVMRFSQKRNELVEECLRGKQVKKYHQLARAINPITLDIDRKVVEKEKKNKKKKNN